MVAVRTALRCIIPRRVEHPEAVYGVAALSRRTVMTTWAETMLKVGQQIEFRGCFFDDGWEFDAPAILYRGAKVNGFGGNAGELENMIERLLIDACIGCGYLPKQFSECDLKEFKWRGWDANGFARRKNATHFRLVVEIIRDEDGELSWDEIERKEQQGPFDY